MKKCIILLTTTVIVVSLGFFVNSIIFAAELELLNKEEVMEMIEKSESKETIISLKEQYADYFDMNEDVW